MNSFFFQNTGQLVHKLDSSKPYTAAFLPLFLNELISVICSFIFTDTTPAKFWKCVTYVGVGRNFFIVL